MHKFQACILEAEEDLEGLVGVLEDFCVKVHRPDLSVPDHYNSPNGLWESNNTKHIDSVTVIGDTIIEGAMSLRARYRNIYV